MIIFQPWWQVLGVILFLLMVGMLILNYIAANKAVESILQPVEARIEQAPRPSYLNAVDPEYDRGTVAFAVDRLATIYDSDYVKLNQPWIRETPFEEWRDRQLADKGMTLL